MGPATAHCSRAYPPPPAPGGLRVPSHFVPPTSHLPPTPTQSHLQGHLLRDPQPPGIPPSRPSAVCPLSVLRAPRGPGDAVEPTLAEQVGCFAPLLGTSRPERQTGSPSLRLIGKLPWSCCANFFMGWGPPSALLPDLGPQRAEARPDPGCPQYGDNGSEMGDEVGAGRRRSRAAAGGWKHGGGLTARMRMRGPPRCGRGTAGSLWSAWSIGVPGVGVGSWLGGPSSLSPACP